MPEETSYFLTKFCAFHLNYTFHSITNGNNITEFKKFLLNILENNILNKEYSIFYIEVNPELTEILSILHEL